MLKTLDSDLLETGLAVIGFAGRFPGAPDVAGLWDVVREGREPVTRFEPEALIAAGLDEALVRSADYVPAVARLADAEAFDAEYFGYSPVEVSATDPQQRVLLECAVEALEDAGCDPARFPGSIGLFAGAGLNPRHMAQALAAAEDADASARWMLLIGADKDFLTTRISYKLQLRGPSVAVQTACSTSLVAVHLACQSLLSGECDAALAGGVSIINSYGPSGYLYSEGDVLSPDGRCRPFDAAAKGTHWGDGAGLVVLKRLDRALADGDVVRAVIRGSAINNDGAAKVGYTAPSIGGQAAVIAEALAVSNIPAETVSYVEAHGTGTVLGDPIEIAGLTQAFRVGDEKRGFCALGSLKGNIGHLNAAAGVAGLIKTILALENEQLPPSINFTAPNPRIDFSNSPFYVNTRLTPWPRSRQPRRAGVSSFGIGGTNAHVILQEAPVPESLPSRRRRHLLAVSARTPKALDAVCARLAERLKTVSPDELADVAHTLMVGRPRHSHARAVICATAEEAIASLRSEPLRPLGGQRNAGARAPAFMFPGQGTQCLGMGSDIYRNEPEFRSAFDNCADLLQPTLGLDLRTALYTAQGADAEAQLMEAGLAQPALFAVSYALARLWMSWGVIPSAMVGYCLGELVAACVAGVIDLPDALRAAAERGRLMQLAPAGDMLMVSAPASWLQKRMGPDLCLAAINGPEACVVAGASAAVNRFRDRLFAESVVSNPQKTAHAFHSPSMDEAARRFTEFMSQVSLRAPTIPFISSLTGRWITDAEAVDPNYWGAQLRGTVRFAEGLSCLVETTPGVLLEVGPGRALCNLTQHNAMPEGMPIIPALPKPDGAACEGRDLLGALGELWSLGLTSDQLDLYPGEARRKIRLPAYPFQRQAFPMAAAPRGRTLPALTSNPMQYYVPGWRSWMPQASGEGAGPTRWLVLTGDDPFSAAFVSALRAKGDEVVTVRRGEGFDREGPGAYRVPLLEEKGFAALAASLTADDALPDAVAYLWDLDSLDGGHAGIESAFGGALRLLQALAPVQVGRRTQFVTISTETLSVLGQEPVNPLAAAAMGLGLALPSEWPNVTSRFVDIVRSDAEGPAAGDLAARIVEDLACTSPDPIVAYRGAARWARTLEPVRPPEVCGAPGLLRPGGVYLITGGLGDLALITARLLAEEVGAKVVLLSRRPAPDRRLWPLLVADRPETPEGGLARALSDIEACGGEVLTVTADVCDQAAVFEAVDLAKQRFGRIDGVIHAAGAGSMEPLLNLTPSEVYNVLTPKTLGLEVLEKAFEPGELDFLLLFSSIAALVGYFGHGAYAAANACLDAAATRPSVGAARRTISVNWDAWGEAGMAANAKVSPGLAAIKARRLESSLSNAEGIAALRQVLSGAWNRVLVAKPGSFALAEAAAQHAAGGPERGTRHPRPPLETAFSPPQTDLQKRIASIFADVLMLDAVGLDDNFFDLGGQSLMGTQVMIRIKNDLGMALPLRALFDTQTVRGLAELTPSAELEEVEF